MKNLKKAAMVSFIGKINFSRSGQQLCRHPELVWLRPSRLGQQLRRHPELVWLRPSRPGQQLRRHPELVSGSNVVSTKKAAMFGLDARIALAIFGALSVISGAALYSAIESARVTTVVTTINEVDKALTARFLDVGADFANYNSSTKNPQSLFIDVGESGWQGPYLPATYSALATSTVIDMYGKGNHLLIKKAIGADWNDVQDAATRCTASDCYLWIQIRYADKFAYSLSMLGKVDAMLDGSDDADSGNVRYFESASYNTILLKSFKSSM